MVVHVVLYQPEIPQNTGNIARTCVALGCALHLIGPYGFRIDEKKVRRAGLDYWPYLQLYEYENSTIFWETVVIQPQQCYYVSTKAHSLYHDVVYDTPAWLFFGQETAGLPSDLLAMHTDRMVRLPMHDDARSLNVSNAVAIMAYEVMRQHNFVSLR